MISKKVCEIYSFSCVPVPDNTNYYICPCDRDNYMRLPILYIRGTHIKKSNIYVHLKRTNLESCGEQPQERLYRAKRQKGEERNMREKKRYSSKGKKYIYSVERANEFMQRGYHCIETGYSLKSHKFFWVFDYEEVQGFYEK